MAGVAFFDLDRTLLDCNSATLWVRRQVREGHISRTKAASMGLKIGLYQLGFGHIEDAVVAAIRDLEGQNEEEIRQRTIAFWEEEVAHRVRPGARAVLEAHRELGESLVLLTGSSNYMSDCVLAALGMDDALCTRFEVQDGLFTGQGVLCYGDTKRVAAEAYLADKDIPLSACAFYTDSYTDLPVMLEVERPVAVHPDPRLKRHARREGWPIADWGVA
jgi:HAD superfamily hydrolase (TIGR01490 family)